MSKDFDEILLFLGFKDSFYDNKNQTRPSPGLFCLYCLKIYQGSYITRHIESNTDNHDNEKINNLIIKINSQSSYGVCNEIINILDVLNFNFKIINGMIKFKW